MRKVIHSMTTSGNRASSAHKQTRWCFNNSVDYHETMFSLDKKRITVWQRMTNFLQKIFSETVPWQKIFEFEYIFHFFVPRDAIENMSALTQVFCLTGDNPSHEPMKAQLTVIYESPGPTFIKPDQLDPWIKDQIKNTLLPTILHLLLPNFGNCRCKIVDSRAFPSWSLIHGLRWSGLIKAEPGGFY